MAAGTRTRSGEAGEEVRAILEKARDEHGGAVALGYALKGAGIVGEQGQAYSESAISNWIKGRSRPPADVLLAAAKLARISVDEHLYPEEAGETDPKDRKRLDKFERELKELREQQRIQMESLREELQRQLRAEMVSLRKDLRKLGQIGRGISTELDEDKRPT